MEGIQHRMVKVNGIKMHVAEKGEGNQVVLFLHGYPELWYSWRHQILAVAARGYKAVAPDLRGFGDTDAPSSVTSYTYFHIVGDLIALIDSLGARQVFVVGHDWGAIIGWYLCLFRPDRVKALVNLSVAFNPRNPFKKPIELLCSNFGNDYYICRFQVHPNSVIGASQLLGPPLFQKMEIGVAEGEYSQANTRDLFKHTLAFRGTGPICVNKDIGFGTLPTSIPKTLPSWLTEDDITYYATKYDEKGFTGGLNYYRALDLNWEVTAPWTGAQVKVPTKFIVGNEDLTYTTPGAKEYIHGGAFKKMVPMLEEVVVIEGVAHFINQEKADDINQHILNFIQKF